MTGDAAYTIVSRVHVNRWDDERRTAVAGWEIQARWLSTGTLLPVFIADASYTAANVDAAIRAAGAQDDAVAKLGA